MLNATINRYAYGTLCPRQDARITIHSYDYGSSVELAPLETPVFDGKLDLAKAAIRRFTAGPDWGSTFGFTRTRRPGPASARPRH